MDSRQILKPVAPSKRPGTERPTQHRKDKFEAEKAFLPKELADVIAFRQRRGRAWHAHLMICTTIISSVESTPASFKNEIEKEEVEVLKAYLRLAIANFAAVDTSPTPQSNGLGKDKNVLKKVAVATSRIMESAASTEGNKQEAHKLPKTPHIRQDTCATVARNGQKKVRVILSNKTQVAPVNQRSENKEISSSTPVDKRLFARISKEYELLKLPPAGLREVIVKKLSISPTLIGKIKPVHSGFVLCPCNTEACEAILTTADCFFIKGAKLEQATNWTPVILSTVLSVTRK
ncbi:putative eka-like protein [Erysiphe necator]|uniref:Putative eka-like protein n=1 Tax=Uncinula necator TaxID=52586 RepID=A0A0B1P9B8_UNCNE|nr:putative eka-like protein [Erysiphe necator]